MPEIININIANILLDIDNFRLGSWPNQQEVIRTLIDDQKEKLINLAEHIAENGLSPLENIGIMKCPEGDDYYVIEGNRRVLSIKILNDPQILIGTALEDQIPKIQEIKQRTSCSQIDGIECVVFASQEDASRWMENKHSGEDEGRGTVQWNAVAKARMKEKFGQTGDNSEANDILTFMQNNGVTISQNYPITNLTRLIKTVDVKNKLGLQREHPIRAICPPEYLLNVMRRIVPDLECSGAVNRIRLRADRMQYIEDLELREFEPVDPWVIKDNNPSKSANNESQTEQKEDYEKSNDTDAAWVGQSSSGNSSSRKRDDRTRRAGERSVPSSYARKKLIPSSFILKIVNKPKINDIYKELKGLDNSDFPYACAVLFRVFIELSIDYYIEAKGLKTSVDEKLVRKLLSVRDHMITNNVMTERDLQPIDSMISNPNLPFSTRSFNGYVHNQNGILITHEILNQSWDTISVFIKKIWD